MVFNELVKKIFGKKASSVRFTPPTIQKSIAGMQGRYNENVKPYIDSGDFVRAHLEMQDIVAYLEIKAEEIYLNIHCGLGYVAASRILLKKLNGATERPDSAIEYFEAMQAQTRLPYIPEV